MLWHITHRIRRHWPKVRILIRGDSHYCAPEVLDLLRRLDCDHILGLPRATFLLQELRADAPGRLPATMLAGQLVQRPISMTDHRVPAIARPVAPSV